MDMDGILRCPRCLKAYDGARCERCGFAEGGVPRSSGYLEPETILAGRYLIGAVLGAGGFGVTYAVWDLTLNQAVAVKEYFPRGVAMRDTSTSDDIETQPGERNARQFEIGRNRFIREARMLSLLEGCPGVVAVKDCLEANKTAYLVMEYVCGVNLEAYAQSRGGRIAPNELLLLMRDPINALAQVHQTGLLHRDISPTNLMLQPDGRVKLIDFGAAASLSGDDSVKDATMILNRNYAAPEQYAKDGELGAWTDVYGVCATMCALLTGDAPGAGGDALGRVRLSGRQRRAIGRGLEPQYKHRIRSMPELLSALYGVPLPEEIARRRRLVRVAAIAVCCSIALSLLMLLNAFWGIPVGGGFHVGAQRNGLALVRYTGSQAAPRIPGRVLGLPVQQIARSAFMNNAAIEAIDVPSDVRTVGDWAFYGCENLRTVRLPEGLSDIGALAFYGCANLGEAALPGSVERIGEAAFGEHGGKLVLYGEADSPADRFAGANGIRFADRREFTFQDGESGPVLTGYSGSRPDITVPSDSVGHPVTGIGSDIRWPYHLLRVALPDGVERIEAHAFEDCMALESVYLPLALKSIGDSAFLNCADLAELTLPDAVEEIGELAFSVCRSLASIALPDGLKHLGAFAFERCEQLAKIRLPDGLGAVEESTFFGCSSLQSVQLPIALQTIEARAFAQCENLTELTIPEGTVSIGEDAFLGCIRLSRAVIPDSVEHIGESAFYACANELVIFGQAGSAAETYAGENGIPFEDMSRWADASSFDYAIDGDTARILRYLGSEQNMVMPSLIENRWVTQLAADGISTGAFEYNETLRSVALPRYATDIPNSCFAHCSSLERVTLPQGVRSIGICAFNACVKLETLALPDNLSAIGWSAFSHCNSLKRLSLPGRMLVLDGGFLADSSVEVLAIGEGTPRIGDVFGGADALRELWIPASVTHIEDGALDECAEHVTIIGQPGSYAESFARDAGIPFCAHE